MVTTRSTQALGSALGNGIDFPFVQGQPEFTCREYAPGNLFSGINSVRTQNAVRENERGRAHTRDSDTFSAQIRNLTNI